MVSKYQVACFGLQSVETNSNSFKYSKFIRDAQWFIKSREEEALENEPCVNQLLSPIMFS